MKWTIVLSTLLFSVSSFSCYRHVTPVTKKDPSIQTITNWGSEALKIIIESLDYRFNFVLEQKSKNEQEGVTYQTLSEEAAQKIFNSLLQHCKSDSELYSTEGGQDLLMASYFENIKNKKLPMSSEYQAKAKHSEESLRNFFSTDNSSNSEIFHRLEVNGIDGEKISYEYTIPEMVNLNLLLQNLRLKEMD